MNSNFGFLLKDRIIKIQSINDMYDLEHNSYIAFSGGKDSTVLHHLIDIALPGNRIPRVFVNTGLEFRYIVDYVKSLRTHDERFIIVNNTNNIKYILNRYGYPFKSKSFSHCYSIYCSIGKNSKTYNAMTNSKFYGIPKKLLYLFDDNFDLGFKISDLCCTFIKKKPLYSWALNNNLSINITGMRNDEKGLRSNLGCTVFSNNKLKAFHPLSPLDNVFIDDFINEFDITLCKLYYEPYNFNRTGCCGCPFNRFLNKELGSLSLYLPIERKRCELLWKPVYDEYRRIGYRLRKD